MGGTCNIFQYVIKGSIQYNNVLWGSITPTPHARFFLLSPIDDEIGLYYPKFQHQYILWPFHIDVYDKGNKVHQQKRLY